MSKLTYSIIHLPSRRVVGQFKCHSAAMTHSRDLQESDWQVFHPETLVISTILTEGVTMVDLEWIEEFLYKPNPHLNSSRRQYMGELDWSYRIEAPDLGLNAIVERFRALELEVRKWRLVAQHVSLAPADTDISTPENFREAQLENLNGLIAQKDRFLRCQQAWERLEKFLWPDGKWRGCDNMSGLVPRADEVRQVFKVL